MHKLERAPAVGALGVFAMTRVLALLALVLLGAFFLPWFVGDVGFVLGTGPLGVSESVSGYKMLRGIVELTIQAADAGAPEAFDHSFRELWPIWLLAAIPLFGVLTLLTGLAGWGLAAAFGFLAGTVPVGETIWLVAEGGSEVFKYFEVGAWVTLGGAVLLVLLAFSPRRG
jgi:hypothetical protein